MIDYDKVISVKAGAIKPSGIRKFFDIVSEMTDAISLGVGEPDFATPWHAKQAAIRSLEKGQTFYTSNWGLIELRREIRKYLNVRFNLDYSENDEILVTVGGSEAIDDCIRTLINPGEEVLIPEPSFVCYKPLTILAGGIPKAICTTQEEKFKLTPEKLKAAITPKTKLLILPYPNNPTGAIMTESELKGIADVLKDTDIMVLSDEIYSELTYGLKHTCFASVDNMKERTVVVNGFSKTYAMTGWRVGYAFGPREIIKTACKIHQFGIMSAPTPSQYCALEAMINGESDIELMRSEYNLRRMYMVGALNNMGLECFEPQGAFYVFPSIKKTGFSSDDFCEKLLREKKVAVIPGSAFGECGEGHVRISYSYSINHLREAIGRMSDFIAKYV